MSVTKNNIEEIAGLAGLEDSSEKFTTLIEALPDAIFLKDGQGRWLIVNSPARALFRLEGVDWQGKTDAQLAVIQPELAPAYEACIRSDAAAWERACRHDDLERVVDEKGHERIFETTKVPLFDRSGGRRGLVIIGRDVTDKKWAEERIHQLANFDQVTGLPNRTLLDERLVDAISDARRQDVSAALLVLDLDNFRRVNDSLGPATGDRLLAAVAERLLPRARGGDTVARLGGDDFAVLLTGIKGRRTEAGHLASFVAEEIRRSMSRPFEADGTEVSLTASVGAAIFPGDGEMGADLLRNADIALNQAKREGQDRQRFFAPELHVALNRRLDLERHLRRAVERGEFAIFYQPQVEADTHAIVGAEALIRWFPAGMDDVRPDEFIPLAEEAGLIREIGAFTLRTVTKQMERWTLDGLCVPRIGVNVSPIQFNDTSFPDAVQNALAEAGLAPDALELEVTERVVMGSTRAVLQTASRLRALGVSLSIDDFGTGFSSLAYLRNFAIDSVKIDRSFVSGIGRNVTDEAIISAILAMAGSLGLRVIAEGVERDDQASYLRQRGCREFQGFLFHRPLASEAFSALLPGVPKG